MNKFLTSITVSAGEVTALNFEPIALTDLPGGLGSGTVTTVSIISANGVSGSVANANTTPAITISLGAITPTSVVASGSISGSNLSGTNTGDQTITLSGDATGSGTAGVAVTLASVISAGGPVGDSTHVPVITWDAKGRLTAVSSAVISGGGGAVSSVSNSDGTLTISPTTGAVVGSLALGHANVWSGQQTFGATNSSTVALLVKAAASQSADLLRCQDSSANSLFIINNNGRVGIGSAADNTYGFYVNTGIAHERIRIQGSTDAGFYLSNAAGTDGATVRYGGTNGFEIFVSNTLEVLQFATDGRLGLGGAVLVPPQAQIHVRTTTTSFVCSIFQGMSGQTADLTQWWNISTMVANVDVAGNIGTQVAGAGFKVKEGSNARMGTGTLSGGTVTIANTSVTANSRIFITDTGNGGLLTNVGSLAVTAIVAGTSFTVKSTNVLDASTFNWIIFEPS